MVVKKMQRDAWLCAHAFRAPFDVIFVRDHAATHSKVNPRACSERAVVPAEEALIKRLSAACLCSMCVLEVVGELLKEVRCATAGAYKVYPYIWAPRGSIVSMVRWQRNSGTRVSEESAVYRGSVGILTNDDVAFPAMPHIL